MHQITNDCAEGDTFDPGRSRSVIDLEGLQKLEARSNDALEIMVNIAELAKAADIFIRHNERERAYPLIDAIFYFIANNGHNTTNVVELPVSSRIKTPSGRDATATAE